MKNKFFIALTVCLVGAATAGDVYVVPGGAEGGNGTRRRPFTTLSQARDAIRAARRAGRGDEAWTVRMAAGDYLLSEPFVLLPEDSGRAGAPVVYQGEGAETRVMGALRVDGWRDTADGLWSAPIPQLPDGTRAYFESLYVNGRRAVRARHPNVGFFSPQTVKQTLCTNDQPRAEFAIAELTARGGELAPLAAEDAAALRYAQVVVHHNWDTTRRMILGFDATSGTLRTQGGRWKPWNPWRTNSLYYVENVRAAFDAPGEWFYDGLAGTILYRPLKGERLPGRWRGAEIFAPRPGLQTLVSIRGDPASTQSVCHVHFRAIAFHYTDSPRRSDQVEKAMIDPAVLGAVDRPGPTQFEPMQAAARTEAAVMADGAHAVTFEACDVAHTGEYGIWFRAGCFSNRVIRCALTDLGAGGIRIGDPGG